MGLQAHIPHLHAQGQNISYWICSHGEINVLFQASNMVNTDNDNKQTSS